MRRISVGCVILCSLFLTLPLPAQHDEDGASISEEVTYSSGDVSLTATLILPSDSGTVPGVVIVHGSGTSDRSNPWTSAYAAALVARGIAVLYPDKRGSGSSAGNWRDASFIDLADDALAGVDLMRTRPQVDAARVGLIGFSQGGHVVPIAATRSRDVSFVVNVSGSVVPMMEQIGDELRRAGEREGLTRHELDTLQSIHKRAERYVATGEGWHPYALALSEAKEGTLRNTKIIDGFPSTPDSPTWDFLRLIGSFDPLPYWQEIDVPALFLYGGRDEQVDVYKSADVIEESLSATGPAFSLLLFKNNGHALFRNDALDFIARWIHDGGID